MPDPLTATEPAQLDLSRPGTPASSEFGDIYFSVEGGLAESREVFLKGCGLPEAWAGRERFVVAETGFGTGLNFLALWQAWKTAPGPRLHFVSIERYPLSREELASVLAPYRDELGAEIDTLLCAWPGRVKGVHRLEFPDLTLDLWHMDVAEALAQMDMRADAWFLDGFSPAKNPDMWAEANLRRIGELSAPGARLASFTVAGAVRRGLAAAGFEVERVEGFGRKRHRLEARMAGAPEPRPEVRPVILGGGIAGASVARALVREGLRPPVIRSPNHMAQAASANPVALVKPRLDKQDRPESRFFLQAWLHARQLYPALERGIVHLPKTEAEAERFAAICEASPLPPEDMVFEGGELRFPTAPVVDPVAVCEAFLEGCDVVEAEVTGWRRSKERWEVISGDEVVAEGTHLVLASGLHLKTALPGLELRASRGQLSWAETDADVPVTYGGYAVPVGGRTLLGATHDRLDGGDPYALCEADDARNRESYLQYGGERVEALESCRASVRVNSANTLPIAGELEPGLFVLGALGSRGFSHATLLGSVVAANIMGAPCPLTRVQSARLSPRIVPRS